ncbi:hypothetical protein CO051_01260 [Candidatus Roizmanbacteria bacterium CG_4_9_14_0_2_um_filter_39_13]|uniref:Uncharacterized protein n=1 Tax=Candidatus Roizmanbacteria bacterium CG_4_9_14_0_2_um_filter_39_13 TaxID=1974839 RepID=A0A2M8F2V6_9BACT|nr:MAG: hypothetical protein CO051_01260 [Candidatus Roizmanbacteria bacterium CG_4_9_14_0_2_um_filter_39_13]
MNTTLPLLIQSNTDSSFHEILKKEGMNVLKNDCIKIHPNGMSIRIDQIRSLRAYLYNAGGSSRQVVFYSFHKASVESQNALLKILEEKGLSIRFALQVESIEQVLSTIRSRCRIITSESLRDLNQGSDFTMTDFAPNTLFHSRFTASKKEDAELICVKCISLLRREAQKGEILAARSIQKICTILNLLKHNNLNPQLAVDQCVILISS